MPKWSISCIETRGFVTSGGVRMAKRVKGRDEVIYIRVTPEEKEAIQGNAADFDLSAPQWLRKYGLSKRNPKSKADMDFKKSMHSELHRIGVNVNQLAMKTNAGTPQWDELNDIKADVKMMLDLIAKQ